MQGEATGFRQRVRNRDRLLGTIVTLPSPDVAELLAGEGFDWLFIDMEHGLIDPAAAQRMIQAVAGACACVVRVPSHEPFWIAKVLDAGADGVIVPHVSSAEQAEAVVDAARYSPTGHRSIGVGRAHAYGRRLAEELATSEHRTAVVAQAEDVLAVKHIDDIARTEGLDAVFIGPFDLSASLGRPGQITDHAVQEAIAHVRGACGRVGLACGILAPDVESARRAFAAGDSLVCVSTDTLLLRKIAREVVDAAQG